MVSNKREFTHNYILECENVGEWESKWENVQCKKCKTQKDKVNTVGESTYLIIQLLYMLGAFWWFLDAEFL